MRSAWIQTGACGHGGRPSASSQSASAVAVSSSPSSTFRFARVNSSKRARSLAAHGVGAAGKVDRVQRGNESGQLLGQRLGHLARRRVLPGSHSKIAHSCGYSAVGLPRTTGTGTRTGSSGASRGSQVSSSSRSDQSSGRLRGMRTTSSCAEPVERVDRPGLRNRLQWQRGPLRELLEEQTTDERDVGLDLVCMPPRNAQARLPPARNVRTRTPEPPRRA